jgi:heptosyltransferase-3
MEERIDRVLVIVPAQLGDVLISTALIRAARERWPRARIDVLGFKGTLDLLAGNPDVAERIEVVRSQGLKAQLRQAAALWRRYDLALVTRTSDRAHLYGFVAAPRRSGLLRADDPGHGWKRRLLQHAFAPRDDGHYVLEKLQLVSPWAELPAAVSLVPPPAQPLPPDLAAALRHPRVVVQVPSMWHYKQWPVRHYRRLVESLLADGVQVVLTGAPTEHDRALVAGVSDVGAAPALLDACGRLSLPQVRSLLDGSDAFVGPDTSVTHLAATVGLPIVTLYGPSLPDAFGPWPQGHPPRQPWQRRGRRQAVGPIVLLQGEDLPGQRCVPCARMGCENRHDSDSHCLQTLAPERVLAEVRALLLARAAAAVGGRDAAG